VTRTAIAVVAMLISGAVAGCASRRAQATSSPVALNVPPPPARVIAVPPEPMTPTEATTVDRPVATARPSRGARPSPVRSDAARPPDPVPADTGAAAVPGAPAATEPVPTPAPVLRTMQSADESQAERRTREVLARARALLSRVTIASLSQEARQQHDTARRFVGQAEQALLERNFVFATYLADKAEALAKGLGR